MKLNILTLGILFISYQSAPVRSEGYIYKVPSVPFQYPVSSTKKAIEHETLRERPSLSGNKLNSYREILDRDRRRLDSLEKRIKDQEIAFEKQRQEQLRVELSRTGEIVKDTNKLRDVEEGIRNKRIELQSTIRRNSRTQTRKDLNRRS